ncbi:MAG: hypothetical protein ABR616_15775 [Dermatophilaceae bacterium]|nr:hypothetical protein [Intrasporangiaceae bacterium]
MESVTKAPAHRLGWCSPGQAHFWNRETPKHEACPGKLGTIECACPHHQGIAPDQVDQGDRDEAERRAEALSNPAPKKKRKRVVRSPR